jgi:GcrA cell cycle regulator
MTDEKATVIHPAFDIETGTWFVDGFTDEAPTIAELLKKLPKIKGGYLVQDYWCGRAPPITLPPPGKSDRGNSNFSYGRDAKQFRPVPLAPQPIAKPSIDRGRKPPEEKFKWTPERIEELTRLVRSGVKDVEIAARWGLSRNAVVGKRHRLGL